MRLHTGTVTRPRFESRPYRMNPGRREFIFGKVQPLETVTPTPWWHSAVIVILGMVAAVLSAKYGWNW